MINRVVILNIVLYGLGLLQLHGRLLLGQYSHRPFAGQSHASATTWLPRALLSALDNRYQIQNIVAVVLYGLGPAQLHGRLVLG